MSKLIMVLTFTALAAFAFAHRPIITTTTTTLIEELGNSVNAKKQCGQRLQGQTFNRCQTYITSSTQNCCLGPEGWGCYPCMSNKEGEEVQLLRQGMVLEECCNELRNVEEDCQCRAMKEVYKQAQQQQGSQQSSQDLQQIVQNLPNQCNLQVKQCRLPSAAMF